jgi:hypothetical protein
MNEQLLPADKLMLERGQALPALDGLQAPLWQVEQGMLLVEGLNAQGEAAWHLALPGDWLNLPRACGLTDGAAAQATALLPSRLRTVPQAEHMSRESLLSQLVAQQQRWTLHLMALRSGSVERRIRHVLALTRQAMGGARKGASAALPILRDVATLVDAVPETVCRVLARLQPNQSERRAAGQRVALA